MGNKPVRGLPEDREKQRTWETCEREFCVKSESLFSVLKYTKTKYESFSVPIQVRHVFAYIFWRTRY